MSFVKKETAATLVAKGQGLIEVNIPNQIAHSISMIIIIHLLIEMLEFRLEYTDKIYPYCEYTARLFQDSYI